MKLDFQAVIWFDSMLWWLTRNLRTGVLVLQELGGWGWRECCRSNRSGSWRTLVLEELHFEGVSWPNTFGSMEHDSHPLLESPNLFLHNQVFNKSCCQETCSVVLNLAFLRSSVCHCFPLCNEYSHPQNHNWENAFKQLKTKNNSLYVIKKNNHMVCTAFRELEDTVMVRCLLRAGQACSHLLGHWAEFLRLRPLWLPSSHPWNYATFVVTP